METDQTPEAERKRRRHHKRARPRPLPHFARDVGHVVLCGNEIISGENPNPT